MGCGRRRPVVGLASWCAVVLACDLRPGCRTPWPRPSLAPAAPPSAFAAPSSAPLAARGGGGPRGGGPRRRGARPWGGGRRGVAAAAGGDSAEAAPPTCASEEGQALEKLFWEGLSAASGNELPGAYRITSSVAVVGPTKELTKPPHIAQLSNGDEVDVTEVALLEAQQRVRGRLAKPEGWISLRNTETGYRWAERSEVLAAFDERLPAAVRQLAEEAAALGFGLEDELKDEVLDRRRSDLLYLSALRRQFGQGLPLLPSFDEPGRASWVFCGGAGLERMRQMAGPNARDVSLAPCTEPLRRELQRAVLAGADHGGALLGAYAAANSGWMGGLPGVSGPFAGFLKGLGEGTKQVLLQVGGASGLPSRNRTAKGEQRLPDDGPGPGQDPPAGSWSDKEMREWLQLFATVSANTRVAQADAYFGHVLFGISLKRLTQRFKLARSLGTLPSLPTAASELGQTAEEKGLPNPAAEAAMQFEAFVQEISARPADDGSTLQELLSLSSSSLAAVRRRAEALFGRGLRDEIAVPMDRASEEVERQQPDPKIPPMKVTASLLLEAASAGEVRMLSVGQPAKERIMWDGIAFGAFLESAETAMFIETQ